MSNDTFTIDLGDGPEEIVSVNDYGAGTYINLADGTEWVVFESREDAGKEAREYWSDMAEHDPAEFTCMVGESTLISWGLGRADGPGTTKVRSLSEWLDLWPNTPEEHFASYDGDEVRVVGFSDPDNEIGFRPAVAYRHS